MNRQEDATTDSPELWIWARAALAHDSACPLNVVAAHGLLLEGSWPHAERTVKLPSTMRRWSLDVTIDARHSVIDRRAAALAELAGAGEECDERPGRSQDEDPLSTALSAAVLCDLHALKLRYWFVRMLRITTFFAEIVRPAAGCRFRVWLGGAEDNDYAELFKALCAARRFPLIMQRRATTKEAMNGRVTPRPRTVQRVANDTARRQLAALDRKLAERRTHRFRSSSEVVLCGNPHLLDPLCVELKGRGFRPWWLYERFAYRTALRWAPRGIGQLCCDGAAEPAGDVGVDWSSCPALCDHGVSLRQPLRAWGERNLAPQASRLVGLQRAVAAHLERRRPAAVVMDEDATPLARVLVRAAHRRKIPSMVVQHGAPCVSFGFAPLAASRIAVWGEATRQQLIAWGVDVARIRVTGRLKRFHSLPVRPKSPSRRVLVLDTVPARDERPDAVSFHLTSASYAQMVAAVVHAIEEFDRLTWIIRPHPRCIGNDYWQETICRYPPKKVRLQRSSSLLRALGASDVVISFASSAGIEAAAAGLPVVQLLPVGSADVLPHHAWNLRGTARTSAELSHVLRRVLNQLDQVTVAPSQKVFAAQGYEAARFTVNQVGEMIADRPLGNGQESDTANRRHVRPAPHFGVSSLSELIDGASAP